MWTGPCKIHERLSCLFHPFHSVPFHSVPLRFIPFHFMGVGADFERCCGYTQGVENGAFVLQVETDADKAEVLKLGGLHVIGTERHESRRIDNQLRGRSGRQGDPGSTRFFLSLEDNLFRVFGGDQIQNMMNMFQIEDLPIESQMLTNALDNVWGRAQQEGWALGCEVTGKALGDEGVQKEDGCKRLTRNELSPRTGVGAPFKYCLGKGQPGIRSTHLTPSALPPPRHTGLGHRSHTSQRVCIVEREVEFLSYMGMGIVHLSHSSWHGFALPCLCVCCVL